MRHPTWNLGLITTHGPSDRFLKALNSFHRDYILFTFRKYESIKDSLHGLTLIYSTTSKEGVQGIRTGFFHFFESKEVFDYDYQVFHFGLHDI
jgi:hypothetical protein